jgi:hypothetical protein|tara:strand:+ start:234 stop:458 length:225 start_codon:yes stop_codon:yes gene_type:complete
MFGEANYGRIDIGDLVSWRDIADVDLKQFGIVIKKYISDIEQRKICMLKVAATDNSQIKNILALIVTIESKKTI